MSVDGRLMSFTKITFPTTRTLTFKAILHRQTSSSILAHAQVLTLFQMSINSRGTSSTKSTFPTGRTLTFKSILHRQTCPPILAHAEVLTLLQLSINSRDTCPTERAFPSGCTLTLKSIFHRQTGTSVLTQAEILALFQLRANWCLSHSGRFTRWSPPPGRTLALEAAGPEGQTGAAVLAEAVPAAALYSTVCLCRGGPGGRGCRHRGADVTHEAPPAGGAVTAEPGSRRPTGAAVLAHLQTHTGVQRTGALGSAQGPSAGRYHFCR